MKKYLFTLIVTMLTYIGAWAQGTVTLSPAPSGTIEMDLANDAGGKTFVLASPELSNYQGNAQVSVVFYDENDNESASSAFVDKAYAFGWDGTLNANVGKLTIKPVKATATPVKMRIKVDNPSYAGQSTSYSDYLYVSVVDKTLATSLSVPSTATVAKGFTTTLDVTFAPETAEGFQVSWAPTDGGVSAYLSADSKKLTIQATASAAENYTVTVTPKAGSSAPAATVNVTVVEPVSIESIALTPATKDILIGEKVALVPTFTPSNPASKHLTWSSSETSIATVDDNGLVIGVARGTVTITATSDNINGNAPVVATATVNVKEELAPAVDKQPNSTLKVGETYTSELALADATMGTFAYTSDNAEVLSVTNDGTLTANKVGTANITVTITPSADAAADNYVAWVRTLAMKVVPAEFGLSIVASPANLTATAGGTVSVTPTVTLNGAATSNTAYAIAYSLEGASSDITINTTGAVTVPANTSVQQFNVVATLTPTDAENYKGAVAKASVLVADPTAQVTISVDAAGVYTVNIPSPGVFTDPSNVNWGENATIEGLKAAESVKVTGLLANNDVKTLISQIGDTNQLPADQKDSEGKPINVCKTLDMGDATMTEALERKVKDGGVITNEWNTDSWIANWWGCNLWYLENLTLPKPTASSTVIPTGMQMWNANDVLLHSLTIPEGWTEISDRAFVNSDLNGLKGLTSLTLANSITTIGESAFRNVENLPSLTMPENLVEIKAHAFECTGLNKLTDLQLNDKLESIGARAFFNLAVEVLNMPYNIQRIDEEAFSGPALKLQDVYFYGPAPRFVHTFAFAPNIQMCNNTVNDELYNEKVDPTTNRFNYQVAGVLACLLHYPEEYEGEYIDVTRKYAIRTDYSNGQVYHKGNDDNKYTPSGWTSDFVSYVTGFPGRPQEVPMASSVDYGVMDEFYGLTMIWPSQGQMTSGWAISHAGKTWSGEDLANTLYNSAATYDNDLYDRRGLLQFMVGMGNATIKYTYEQDKWYTISLPFNMTVDEIKRIFGENTQVCRFSKVTRVTNPDLSKGEKKEIRLEFRNSVMEDALTASTDYVGTYYKPYSGYDAEGNLVTEPATTVAGIRHHYPYMIKPSGTVNEDPAIKIDGEKRIFNGKGFKRIQGTLHADEVLSSDNEFYYAFAPILQKNKIKANSYILIDDNGAHKYAFYKGAKNDDDEYVDGGHANQNTAYVQLPVEAEVVPGSDPVYTDRGKQEYEIFFAPQTPAQTDPAEPTVGAKAIKSIFGDEIEDVNEIEKIVIVCGTDGLEDNKVYTIGGQLVNASNLPAGLYIKNGKKFIVK